MVDVEFLVHPEDESIAQLLERELTSNTTEWQELKIAVAFTKESGALRLKNAIKHFVERNGKFTFITGTDLAVSTYEGTKTILECAGPTSECWIRHNESPFSTFHPKIYVLANAEKAIVIGSSVNVTDGGFFLNDEFSVITRLNLTDPAQAAIYARITRVFNSWTHGDTSGMSKRLTKEFLDILLLNSYIFTEAVIKEKRKLAHELNVKMRKETNAPNRVQLFGRLNITAPSRQNSEIRDIRLRSPGDPRNHLTHDEVCLRVLDKYGVPSESLKVPGSKYSKTLHYRVLSDLAIEHGYLTIFYKTPYESLGRTMREFDDTQVTNANLFHSHHSDGKLGFGYYSLISSKLSDMHNQAVEGIIQTI